MGCDFLVIGAGFSGITSAITLAQNGHQVTLLEKGRQTAPLLRGFSRGGVHFDTGFHYTGGLGPGETLDIFLRYLGLAGHLTSFPFDPEGFDVLRCEDPDFEFRMPTGYARLQDALGDAFPGERAAIAGYLAQVRSVYSSLPYLNLQALSPDPSLERILGATLRETLDALTGNELLKGLLSMHCLLYGVASDEVSFVQHAAIAGSYYQSARGIRGGGLSLARACERRLSELGVEVRCGAEVAGITIGADGAFSGVRLVDGEPLSAKAAISTVHPRLLRGLVPEGALRPSYLKRLGALEETVSAFLCFAGSPDPLPQLSGANRFLFPDPGCMRDLGKRPVGAGPLYLSASYREGGVEPHGFIGISPALYSSTAPWEAPASGRRPEGYREFKEQALCRIQAQIERGYPDLAGRFRFLEGSTPLTLRDYCSSPLGGLYGAKHRVGQHNPHPTTRIPGLFLAGQAVASPGVMGAALSGFLACGSVLGHDHLRKELKACC